jgi:hypothetical protein
VAGVSESDQCSPLNDEHKTEIVMRLAAFYTPRSVIRMLAEEYGVTISLAEVRSYDPTRYAGRALIEQWTTLFYAMRDAVVAGSEEIGAANKMVRVRWLDGMARDAMDNGAFRVAREMLAEAAKEMGDRDAGKQKHERSEPSDSVADLSEAELDRRITASAASLGLRLVPLRSDEFEAPAGEEIPPLQQAGEPVSG